MVSMICDLFYDAALFMYFSVICAHTHTRDSFQAYATLKTSAKIRGAHISQVSGSENNDVSSAHPENLHAAKPYV